MEKKNRIALAIIGGVLIILGLWLGFQDKSEKPQNSITQNVITHKEIHLSAADLAIAQKNLAATQKAVQGLNDQSTDDVRQGAYMQLGAAEDFLGNLSEAKGAFQKAVDTGFRSEDALSSLSSVQAEMHDFANAEKSIAQAVLIAPYRTDLWRNYIKFEQTDIKLPNTQVEQLYVQALQKTNNAIDIQTSYAEFLEGENNIKGAINVWENLKVADPSRASIYQAEIDRLSK